VASDAVRDGIERQAVVTEKGIFVVFSFFARVRSGGGEYFHHGLVISRFLMSVMALQKIPDAQEIAENAEVTV
jgi:hypothetical protein